ncbi:MAG TPA: helix-turn-helix transcriptional regulator [Asticcacaulis sp.]|nr:helix-turn-helix transcriptional regulator [Asticcacaulis sp.]
MSSDDPINSIEDEPYERQYRGAVSTYAEGRDHLPDRFDLADILRSSREARGWSLDQVEEMTRVRRNYLEALETAAYDILPPRAFAIGYVKAYAKALNLDEETLADMFKRDVSDQHPRLQAPSGASLEDVKPNYRIYITAAVCLVAAVAIWNVLQRKPINFNAKARAEAALSSQAWSMGVPLIKDGVVYISKPQQAPKDQDIPAPYVTPGLEDGFASLAAEKNHDEVAPVPVQDVLQSRKAFNPHGAIYGTAPEQSAVTLQATNSVNLVVRGGDGTIYFAHQLGAGEAYRIPTADSQNLVVDVSNFGAFEVYYNGIYAGGLDALVTPVSKINAKAAQTSAQMDAKQASQGQISTIYRGPAAAPQRPTYQPKSTAPIPYMPAKPAASSSAAPQP